MSLPKSCEDARSVGVADQLLVEERRVEHVDAHAAPARRRCVPGIGCGTRRLLVEADDAASSRRPPSRRSRWPPATGTSMQATSCRPRCATWSASMRAVVHLVDVVAGEHQHVLRSRARAAGRGSGTRHRRCRGTSPRSTRCCAGSSSMNSPNRPSRKVQPRWTCRIRLCALYWVATPMRRMPEFTQFDSAKSMMRNLPPNGTAGLARQSVRWPRRAPRPPASTMARRVACQPRARGALVLVLVGAIPAVPAVDHDGLRAAVRRSGTPGPNTLTIMRS